MNKKQILKVLSLLLLIALSSSYGAADLTKNIPTFRGNLLKVGTKVDQIDKIIESSCKNYKNSFHAKDLFRPYHSINEFITQIKQKPSEFKVSEPGQKVRLALAGFLAFFSCYGSYRFLPYIIFDPVTEDDPPYIIYLMTGLAILESALFLPQAIAAFLEEEKTTFDKDELTYIKTNGKWRISAIFAEIQSVMWEDVSKIVLQKTVSVDHKKKEIIDEMYVELFDDNDQLLCNSNDIYLSNHYKDAILFLKLVTDYKAEHDNCSPESIDIQLLTEIKHTNRN